MLTIGNQIAQLLWRQDYVLDKSFSSPKDTEWFLDRTSSCCGYWVRFTAVSVADACR
jgi:hypothetical protein